MAHAHSTFRVNTSRGLRITHAIAFALSHALNVTVILVSILSALYVRIHTSVSHRVESFLGPLMVSASYVRICTIPGHSLIHEP